MIVLVGDDDPTTRDALRHATTGTVDCEFVEARSGPDVLDKLHRQPPDALVMDERLAIVDGMEALRVIRRCPQFAGLPVVITTAGIDEPRAKSLIALGVRDIVLKPLDDARLERLTKLFGLIETDAGAGSVTRQQAAHAAVTSTAIIVDGDKDYRDYFVKAVGGRLTMTEADSGAKALELCHETSPSVVFVGTDLGLLDRAEVAQRIRSMPRKAIRVVAIAQRAEAVATRASGLFDDVLQRTFAPAVFEKELARCFGVTTTFERLRDRIPNLQTRMVRAVEQVFGTMLGTDVESQEAPCRSDGATATVMLSAQPFVMTLRVRCAMDSARAIAGARRPPDAAEPSDEDVLAAVGEAVNLVAARLGAAFEEVQLQTTIGPPQSTTESTEGAGELLEPNNGIDLSFQAVDSPMSFRIQLTAEPLDADRPAAAEAAESDAVGADTVGADTVGTDTVGTDTVGTGTVEATTAPSP